MTTQGPELEKIYFKKAFPVMKIQEELSEET